MIIGIDPGKDTGFAVYQNGKLTELSTYDPLTMLSVLKTITQNDLIIIEDSRLQCIYPHKDRKTGKPVSTAVKLKIARDVGRIDFQCSIIEQMCVRLGLKLISISPKQKGEKLSVSQFKDKTGWAEEADQHEIDAAMVAWPFRHSRSTLG